MFFKFLLSLKQQHARNIARHVNATLAPEETLYGDFGASAGRRRIENGIRDSTLNHMAPLYDALCALLISIGEDPGRGGLQRTPERFERAFRELTCGYGRNPDDIIAGALFAAESYDLVLIRGIAFASLCEHHLIPFVGSIHVGYLPDKRIIGLSKIPRIVELYARRLQTQERLGRQICDALENALKPRGVGVVIEAEHLCMRIRGVGKQGALVRSHHFGGELQKEGGAREEFLRSLEDSLSCACESAPAKTTMDRQSNNMAI